MGDGGRDDNRKIYYIPFSTIEERENVLNKIVPYLTQYANDEIKDGSIPNMFRGAKGCIEIECTCELATGVAALIVDMDLEVYDMVNRPVTPTGIDDYEPPRADYFLLFDGDHYAGEQDEVFEQLDMGHYVVSEMDYADQSIIDNLNLSQRTHGIVGLRLRLTEQQATNIAQEVYGTHYVFVDNSSVSAHPGMMEYSILYNDEETSKAIHRTLLRVIRLCKIIEGLIMADFAVAADDNAANGSGIYKIECRPAFAPVIAAALKDIAPLYDPLVRLVPPMAGVESTRQPS